VVHGGCAQSSSNAGISYLNEPSESNRVALFRNGTRVIDFRIEIAERGVYDGELMQQPALVRAWFDSVLFAR
jgi:hypothetical protein